MQTFRTSSSVGCLRKRGKIMGRSEKFQLSTSILSEFYGWELFGYQIITGGTHYLLSVYQFYSVDSMFIIDINKISILYFVVFLWYPLLALPVSLVIFIVSYITLRP